MVGSISINLGSTTVMSLSSIVSSRSKIDINEGIWSSYNRRAAAEGMFGGVKMFDPRFQ